jgi:L-2-hydroxyglutarate oxidase LhgO
VYERCRAWRLPHRVLGKLVVAVDESERAGLESLLANARANDVPDLVLLDAGEVRALEPQVRAVAALHSPRSGIVDAHALAASYAAEAESAGAALVLHAEMLEAEPDGAGLALRVRDADGGEVRLACAAAVNAAGLAADRVARQVGVDVDARGWRIHPCKGDYFALAPGAPVTLGRLVYPLPGAGGTLGVHATLDLGGRVRFGPDAEYVDAPHYDVDAAKAEAFADAAGRWLPDLRSAWLSPDMAGVRPRLAAPGEPNRDFVLEADGAWIHLVGIESPGLTAAPAIAEQVTALLRSL